MADVEVVRRREVRRKRILEDSEARLKRITSSISGKNTDQFSNGNALSTTKEHNPDTPQELEPSLSSKTTTDSLNRINILPDDNSHMTNTPLVRDEDSMDHLLTNGDFSRHDSYTFPKKVSDAETRSFGRTRSDARRNSTCTQMMMETLQFSSFSLAVLRPWLAAGAGVFVQMFFLFCNQLPLGQSLFFPFLMLEAGFCSWSKLEGQNSNRPATASFISEIMLLCGIPAAVTSCFNYVVNLMQCITVDFAVYIFTFVWSHFVYELCM